MYRRAALVVLTTVLFLVAIGCNSSGKQQTAGQTTAEQDFRELGLVYEYIAAEKSYPPRDLEDMRTRHSDALIMVIPKIESGDYVVFWGVGRITSGSDSETVLAYEKNAASAGGWVLLRSGTSKRVTAQEFAALRKAR
jgi:hypothetical protein